MNPIALFKQWQEVALKKSDTRHPGACCLSTIGLDGYPNARFVSLKEVLEDSFVVTGPLSSRKGNEIENCNKVALTFWWMESELQVRIQGNAIRLSDELADKYFNERPTEAKIVSQISNQGQEINDLQNLNRKYLEAENLLKHQNITRPDKWGGYRIAPIRMEFMEFKATRFHDRKLFELREGEWLLKQLQP